VADELHTQILVVVLNVELRGQQADAVRVV